MAIAATGLAGGAAAKAAKPGLRELDAAFASMGVLQIDAVNAVARSHLLVLRARLGGGARGGGHGGGSAGGDHDGIEALLARAAWTGSLEPTGNTASKRRLTEYWCHEASFCSVSDWPLYRWRMKRAEAGEMWKPLAQYAQDNRTQIAAALKLVERHGPATTSELDRVLAGEPAGEEAGESAESPNARRKPKRRPSEWGPWSDTKKALGWLFWAGYVGVAGREKFQRRYDPIERVLPSEIVSTEMDEASAQRELLAQAARCLGVATAADLGDYHRLAKREATARIDELVEEGRLVEVRVQGWDEIAYLPGGGTASARTKSRETKSDGVGTDRAQRQSKSVLLSPFDPLVWFRPRAERLFGFHYRLEIYTPAAKRRYGYYVLPFLHQGRLAARVDVRSDRAGGVLQVLGAFAEPPAGSSGEPTGEPPNSRNQARAEAQLAEPLARELTRLARWLGFESAWAADSARGDLARPLTKALRSKTN